MPIDFSRQINPAVADFLDQTVIPILRYIFPRGTIRELSDRAYQESAEYAYQNMGDALAFKRIEALWQFAFDARPPEGLVVEFGVYRGASINFFSGLTAATIFGFDSFQGLKENWGGTNLRAGAFSLEGKLPMVRPNVELVPGWFDQTLPVFLERERSRFSLVHIDCDTYEATRSVLSLAADRFTSGTVVIFDEYFGYRGWRQGEFKAWQEFISATGASYDYLAFSNAQVVVRIR